MACQLTFNIYKVGSANLLRPMHQYKIITSELTGDQFSHIYQNGFGTGRWRILVWHESAYAVSSSRSIDAGLGRNSMTSFL